jgi:hypothetical protein
MISDLMKRIPELHRIAKRRYPQVGMAWNRDVESWVFTSEMVPEFHAYICDYVAKWEDLEGHHTENCLAIWDYWNTEEDERKVGISAYPEQAIIYAYKTVVETEIDQTLLSGGETKRTAREAAQALRAIPSEARAQASRENGKKGGRPPLYHVISELWGDPVDGTLEDLKRQADVYREEGDHTILLRVARRNGCEVVVDGCEIVAVRKSDLKKWSELP